MAKIFKSLKKLALLLALPVLLYVYAIKLAISPGLRLITSLLQALGIVEKPAAVVRTPEERFAILEQNSYPFKPHYIEFNGLRVHYVDEHPADATRTVLLLHGEPSWSFLYRHMIPFFSNAGYRVIAPDFIGFGRSDKYTSVDAYSHELHTSTLLHLITKLDLQNVTMVVQDWGGLTGLSVAKHIPDRLASLVIMNTGLPGAVIGGADSLGARLWHTAKLVANPLNIAAFLSWRSFVGIFGTRMPIGRIFKGACKGLNAGAVQCYEAPFHTSHAKAGAAKWPLLVPISPLMHVAKDMQETADFLANWQKPAKIIFSDRDPITRGLDRWFNRLIPGSAPYGIDTVENAGHFLQEDKGEQVAALILAFLAKCNQRARAVPATATATVDANGKEHATKAGPEVKKRK